MEKWTDKLTPEQEKIMNVLSGFLADIPVLFEIVTKDMDKKTAELCKIGYIQSLLHELNMVDIGFWNQEGKYEPDIQTAEEEE